MTNLDFLLISLLPSTLNDCNRTRFSVLPNKQSNSLRMNKYYKRGKKDTHFEIVVLSARRSFETVAAAGRSVRGFAIAGQTLRRSPRRVRVDGAVLTPTGTGTFCVRSVTARRAHWRRCHSAHLIYSYYYSCSKWNIYMRMFNFICHCNNYWCG